MDSSIFLLLFVFPLIAVASAHGLASTSPSLYVFGASMVDSGENAVAMPFRACSDFYPYGSDYFGKPVGRWSNGRTFMDLITQGLGFGLLSPYLRSVGSDFTHGVNFASSGSTAQNTSATGFNSGGLFSLLLQIEQFREYQADVLSRHQDEFVPAVANAGLQNLALARSSCRLPTLCLPPC